MWYWTAQECEVIGSHYSLKYLGCVHTFNWKIPNLFSGTDSTTYAFEEKEYNAKHKGHEIYRQISNSAVVNVSRSVIVECIGCNNALSRLILAICTPVNHPAIAWFISSDPRHDHCVTLMVSLCYMNLNSRAHTYQKLHLLINPIMKKNKNMK